MREKSIREKLGKIFSKWFVITLLAGILVPVAPREVKADDAVINYTPDGALEVRISGTFTVSNNYVISVVISDSSTPTKQTYNMQENEIARETTKLTKSWNKEALAEIISKKFDSNGIKYPLKFESVKVGDASCNLNGTVPLIDYKKVDGIKFGEATEISVLEGNNENTVDLDSIVTIDPADAGGKTIKWSEITGDYIFTDASNKKIKFAPGKTSGIGTVKCTIVDGIFYGVDKTEIVNIKSIQRCTELDKSVHVMSKNTQIDLSQIFHPKVAGYSVTYALDPTAPTSGLTIQDGKIAYATAAGKYPLNATIKNGNGPGNDAIYPITLYVDTIDIDITGSVDTVTKGYKVSFTAETPVDCTFTWKTSKSAESKKVEDDTSTIASTSSVFSFKPTSTGKYSITCIAKYNGVSYETKVENILTVRKPPEISYDKSNRKITIFLPEDIEIGESDVDDVELYGIDGYKLEYEFDGTKKSKTVENLDIGESGKTITISETDVKSYVKDVIDGKSFNEKKVTFKLIPRSGDDESKLNPTCEANVSKITVTADSSNSAAFSTQTYYGLEGVSQSITATPNSGYTFLKWSDGNTSKTRTVNFGEKASTYYAISKEGATPTPGPGTTVPKAGGAAGDGLDSVPKTAQNMIPFFMIMLAAFAAAAVVFVLVKNTMGQPAGSNIPESLKLLDFSSKKDKDKK